MNNKHVSLTGMPRLTTIQEQHAKVRQQTENIRKAVEQKNNYFVLRNIAMNAMIEVTLLMASDDILEIDDIQGESLDKLQEHRCHAIDYFDKCRDRFIQEINKDEDFSLDFQQNVSKKMRRKLTAFCNAVTKQAKTLSVTQHIETVSKIAVTMKLIETLNVYYNMTRQLPWYRYIKKNSPIERGLSMLDYCYKHLAKCLDILDPDMHKSPEQNKVIDKQYDDVIKIWSGADLYLKALGYAEKEQKKEQKKTEKQ